MDENNKEKNNKELKPSEILHDHSKVSSLRTYQGDMAEFIHEKDESIASIALKEKARQDEQKRNEPEQPKKSHLKTVLAVLASIILITLGGIAAFFVSKTINQNSVSPVVFEQALIPYTNVINLSSINRVSLYKLMQESEFARGVSIVLPEGNEKGIDLDTFIENTSINLPATLSRNLNNEMEIGIIKTSEDISSPFIILKSLEFGGTFTGMLEWERVMSEDLNFIALQDSASSTTMSWKDVIVKNKDTRALMNSNGKSVIAYTFLNKQTILVTQNIDVIPDLNSIFTSASVSR